LLPAATVWLVRELVNSLVTVIGAGADWAVVSPVLLLVALVAGIKLLTEALSGATKWLRTVQAELLQDHLTKLVHDKARSVDVAFYENPSYHDRVYRARVDASRRSVSLLENTGSLLQNGITLLAMVAILTPYGPW